MTTTGSGGGINSRHCSGNALKQPAYRGGRKGEARPHTRHLTVFLLPFFLLRQVLDGSSSPTVQQVGTAANTLSSISAAALMQTLNALSKLSGQRCSICDSIVRE